MHPRAQQYRRQGAAGLRRRPWRRRSISEVPVCAGTFARWPDQTLPGTTRAKRGTRETGEGSRLPRNALLHVLAETPERRRFEMYPASGPSNSLTRGRSSLRILTSTVLLLVIAPPAFAYSDPGSGALVWQLALACFASGLFYLYRLIRWIRSRSGDQIPPKPSDNERE